MSTRAVFSEINKAIIDEFSKSNYLIWIAVAWFTDIQIINLLKRKAKEGVSIELILTHDENNINNQELRALMSAGASIFIYGTESSNDLMHNKFSIIDLKTVITGSYNYSYQAKNNSENIVISKDENLANQYSTEFKKLKSISNKLDSVLKENIYKNIEVDFIEEKDNDLQETKIRSKIEQAWDKLPEIWKLQLVNVGKQGNDNSADWRSKYDKEKLITDQIKKNHIFDEASILKMIKIPERELILSDYFTNCAFVDFRDLFDFWLLFRYHEYTYYTHISLDKIEIHVSSDVRFINFNLINTKKLNFYFSEINRTPGYYNFSLKTINWPTLSNISELIFNHFFWPLKDIICPEINIPELPLVDIDEIGKLDHLEKLTINLDFVSNSNDNIWLIKVIDPYCEKIFKALSRCHNVKNLEVNNVAYKYMRKILNLEHLSLTPQELIIDFNLLVINKKLKTLIVNGYNKVELIKLIEDRSIINFECVENLEFLENISLPNLRGINSLEPLQKLKNIKYIDLGSRNINIRYSEFRRFMKMKPKCQFSPMTMDYIEKNKPEYYRIKDFIGNLYKKKSNKLSSIFSKIYSNK
jgi:hypothetical protein